MNRDERAGQDRDAEHILATCDGSTDRNLAAWAAGVFSGCAHALDVISLLDRRHLPPEGCGGTIRGPAGNCRNYDGNRRGISILADTSGHRTVVAAFTWREIAEALQPDQIGDELIAEMRLALRLRRERTDEWLPALPKSWPSSPPARKQQRISASVEEWCYDLGAQAWARCRPVDRAEPADLLELLAEMAA